MHSTGWPPTGLLDDAAVAEAEAASRMRRGEAPGRVRQRLRQKGVDAEAAEAAIAAAVAETGMDEGARCLEVARKRWARLAGLEPAVGRRRLAGFLQRRGFSAAAIAETLRTVTRD